jgi:lipid-binding SYLF domain-containing protein
MTWAGARSTVGKTVRWVTFAVAAVVAMAAADLASAPGARAASGAELSREASAALKRLYEKQPSARVLGEKARAILVFPSILKAGFLFGGQIGEGAMFQGGRTVAYYNSVAASYGFQAGVQTFGYALFFMNEKALNYLNSSQGFELGVGPSLVVVDQGMGRSITSTTLTEDVYAFIFDQKGLMAGMGIQGSKLTKISK